MDASLASYQARLATFQGAPATKSRRTSNRSKKPAAKSKAAWPLAAPSAEALAYAGFVWKPTTASPDNVQCWACNCQLDGWEEADVPAYEHQTHSPSCGFAIVTTIRLRHGDPSRTEEDPISETMVNARKETFADLWPLDTSAGFPSVDQLAAAGWFYDPADGTPDGVTCAYCHLSLDAWDAGDDPMEEHRRRAPDCLFFALTDMYHPPQPEPKKAKRATKSTATKSKRTSNRSSTASTAAASTTTKKRSKRTSTRSSTASIATTTTTKKPKRGKKRTSEAMEDTQYSEIVQEPPKRMRYSSISSFPDDLPVGTPKKMPTEVEPEPFAMSSIPASLPVATPKKTPSHLKESKTLPSEADNEPFTMSSLPASLLAGTPKRTPPHLKAQEENEDATAWEPTDVEALLNASQRESRSFANDVLVDAGLDELTMAGGPADDVQAAVLAGLTDAERSMSIEQWVLYNAKRGEEKLRMMCEQQIGAFEREGMRALDTMEAIATY